MKEIPGFYFDKEKNRYFEAQKGAPASKAFSSHDIKRRKLRDEHAVQSHASKVACQGRVQRSNILEAPLSGGFLAREQGLTPRLAFPEIFAGGLTSGILFGFDNPNNYCSLGDALFDVDYRNEQYPHVVRIIYSSGLMHQYPLLPDLKTCEDEEENEYWGYGTEGTPLSMCSNDECSRHLITVRTDDRSASISLVPFNSRSEEQPDVILGPGYTRGRNPSVLSSAPAKNNLEFFFACGTSYGIMAIDKFLDPVWITPPILASAGRIPETCPRDIFALQFLAETPSVLLSGGRLGLLHINDLRIGNSFEKNLDWIYHPSSITHIKQIDPHRIIVAGLNSSLRQYDLRYRKADTIIPKNHGRGTPTRSIVQYPDYFNTATVECGFDVDVESGIVAVSQEYDEQHSAVQLFSLNGGHTLSSPALTADFGPKINYDNSHIRCIKFARDSATQVKSLFFATEYNIHKYGWGPSRVPWNLEPMLEGTYL